MKVYFHKFYTEAHRSWRRGAAFANALEAAGVEVSLVLDSSCDVALCGAFSLANEFAQVVKAHDEHLNDHGKPPIPKVQLCWDLYPFHYDFKRIIPAPMTATEKEHWDRYQLNLLRATLVVAPSASAALRIERRLARINNDLNRKPPKVKVVLAACDPWPWEGGYAPDPSSPPLPARHVVDVMRPYDDWGCGKVKAACAELGLPCVELGGRLGFAEFKKAVAEARVLACAYTEASTGGLTLLEGYALGKAVVAPASRWNGARDYLGNRATYFEGGEFDSLKEALKDAWGGANPARPDCLSWVRGNYSDARMAADLARVIGEAIGEVAGA